MKLFLFISFLMLANAVFGQTDADSTSRLVVDTIAPTAYDESFETSDDFLGYDITNATLLNHKKVFKVIYKEAKKRNLLNGESLVRVSVFVDSSGKLLSAEFYGVDSAYTFMRKIFLKKAKYSAPVSSKGYTVSQAFPEYIIMTREFLLGEFENQPALTPSGGDKIKSVERDYYVRIKVSEIFHNGISDKVSIDIKEKIKSYQTPVIKLNDNVAVYFEFPQVRFKSEEYFLCNYYIKEKVGGLWNTRCSGVLNDIKFYNKSFVSGITCGANDDPMRLELKLDVSLETKD